MAVKIENNRIKAIDQNLNKYVERSVFDIWFDGRLVRSVDVSIEDENLLSIIKHYLEKEMKLNDKI